MTATAARLITFRFGSQECDLQNLAFEHGKSGTRYEFERRTFEKIDIGNMLDQLGRSMLGGSLDLRFLNGRRDEQRSLHRPSGQRHGIQGVDEDQFSFEPLQLFANPGSDSAARFREIDGEEDLAKR